MTTGSAHHAAERITANDYVLKKYHDETVEIASVLMRIAGADFAQVVQDHAGFWTFPNTGKHATIHDAIERVGAHPAARKLVERYTYLLSEMMRLEQENVKLRELITKMSR